MYKLFLCIRYLFKRRIAFFAVAAVSLCVAMVLIVVSVMGGFLQNVRDHSRGLLGDLIMENTSMQGFPHYGEFIDEIKTDIVIGPMIEEATPVILTYGVLRFPEIKQTQAVQVVGLRLEETYRVNAFKKSLFYEEYYPGSTTLTAQQQPGWGYNEKDEAVLPPDLEAAYTRWKQNASPREIEDQPIEVRAAYKKPGLYGYAPFTEEMKQPTPGWSGQEYPGIILGVDLAASRLDAKERKKRKGNYHRNYLRGEKVQLTCMTMSDTGILDDAAPPLKLICRATDDSRTGVYEIDSNSAYLDFDFLQHQLDMADIYEDGELAVPARTTQIQIKLKPGVDPHAAKELIRKEWAAFSLPKLVTARVPSLIDSVTIKTWEEKQERFIGAVEKEKVLVTTLFGVISVVAIFLVGCIFYMIVQQNTRDIGIIKSVGATALGVAGIFIAYGIAIGVVGGAIGTTIGTVFVWNINEIQDALASLNPDLVIWDPTIYTFDRIPSHVKGTDLVVIYVVAIIASMIGSLMAAARAAMVWPVEALRYE